jgi:hypothetical protein
MPGTCVAPRQPPSALDPFPRHTQPKLSHHSKTPRPRTRPSSIVRTPRTHTYKPSTRHASLTPFPLLGTISTGTLTHPGPASLSPFVPSFLKHKQASRNLSAMCELGYPNRTRHTHTHTHTPQLADLTPLFAMSCYATTRINLSLRSPSPKPHDAAHRRRGLHTTDGVRPEDLESS